MLFSPTKVLFFILVKEDEGILMNFFFNSLHIFYICFVPIYNLNIIARLWRFTIEVLYHNENIGGGK
jgi:hypothetical protein